MKKAYVSKKKIIDWYVKNDPQTLLMIKLRDGERIDEYSSYDSTWMDEFDGYEVEVDKKDPCIVRVYKEQPTRLGEGYERVFTLEINQPEEGAFIEWRESQ
jgi:hypothetical protein